MAEKEGKKWRLKAGNKRKAKKKLRGGKESNEKILDFGQGMCSDQTTFPRTTENTNNSLQHLVNTDIDFSCICHIYKSFCLFSIKRSTLFNY